MEYGKGEEAKREKNKRHDAIHFRFNMFIMFCIKNKQKIQSWNVLFNYNIIIIVIIIVIIIIMRKPDIFVFYHW